MKRYATVSGLGQETVFYLAMVSDERERIFAW